MSEKPIAAAVPAEHVPPVRAGVSPWILVTQQAIDQFGVATLDPDPMHVDPAWARLHSPFGGAIAFGFLTMSLLTHMAHAALGSQSGLDPSTSGVYLNYGFDRLRLVTPVPAGSRIRGHFREIKRERDAKGRWRVTLDCRVEIERESRPALVASWLSVWLPPGTR